MVFLALIKSSEFGLVGSRLKVESVEITFHSLIMGIFIEAAIVDCGRKLGLQA